MTDRDRGPAGTASSITIRDLHVFGEAESAWAELEIDCPGLPVFRCEVTLVRETFAGTYSIGGRPTRFGPAPGWACPRLLRAFERLLEQVDPLLAEIAGEFTLERSALTSAICEEVTDAALAREWTREHQIGDGLDPCPMLVAPGPSTRAWSSVLAAGEIRDGHGYPAASFRWEQR